MIGSAAPIFDRTQAVGRGTSAYSVTGLPAQLNTTGRDWFGLLAQSVGQSPAKARHLNATIFHADTTGYHRQTTSTKMPFGSWHN